MPLPSLVSLISAPFASIRRKKLLAHGDITSIRNLHWKEFEKLVAEAFRRIGYAVADAGPLSGDGGVDFVATAPSERLLVQCEQRHSAVIGVPTVRELFRVMTTESATGGALVTSGSFSEDAVMFAGDKAIQLIDGAQLERLVSSIKH